MAELLLGTPIFPGLPFCFSSLLHYLLIVVQQHTPETNFAHVLVAMCLTHFDGYIVTVFLVQLLKQGHGSRLFFSGLCSCSMQLTPCRCL